MSEQPYIALNDGNKIPQLGLGVWKTTDDEAASVIKVAVETGYRHIDTAAMYDNERGVGEGIKQCGLDRSEIFLTTKLWNSEQGYDSAMKAFDASLKRLALEYVDLYLIHWPVPRLDRFVDTWKAFIKLKEEGRIRSIGVSNFNPEHIERLVGETGVTPVINQIELHPDFQQKDIRSFNEQHAIATESWSPLGQGGLLEHPVITSIAKRLGRTPAQIIIRWHIDNGLVVIPKSSNPGRIAENFKVFDFSLSAEDLREIATLDEAGNRLGADPLTADF